MPTKRSLSTASQRQPVGSRVWSRKNCRTLTILPTIPSIIASISKMGRTYGLPSNVISYYEDSEPLESLTILSINVLEESPNKDNTLTTPLQGRNKQ